MHPHQDKIKKLIDGFKGLIEGLPHLLDEEDLSFIRLRIESTFKKEINYLSALIGEDGVKVDEHHSQPITRIMGRDLVPTAKIATEINEAPVVENKFTPEINELIATVTELYPKFREIETPAILDTYSDIEIRAIGKKAGLPVTDNSPANVDAKFVEAIKEAMNQTDIIANKGNVGGEGNDGNGAVNPLPYSKWNKASLQAELTKREIVFAPEAVNKDLVALLEEADKV